MVGYRLVGGDGTWSVRGRAREGHYGFAQFDGRLLYSVCFGGETDEKCSGEIYVTELGGWSIIKTRVRNKVQDGKERGRTPRGCQI